MMMDNDDSGWNDADEEEEEGEGSAIEELSPPTKKRKESSKDENHCVGVGFGSCNDGNTGHMVQCTTGCKKWFHFKCVGLLKAPLGQWLCPTCVRDDGASLVILPSMFKSDSQSVVWFEKGIPVRQLKRERRSSSNLRAWRLPLQFPPGVLRKRDSIARVSLYAVMSDCDKYICDCSVERFAELQTLSSSDDVARSRDFWKNGAHITYRVTDERHMEVVDEVARSLWCRGVGIHLTLMKVVVELLNEGVDRVSCKFFRSRVSGRQFLEWKARGPTSTKLGVKSEGGEHKCWWDGCSKSFANMLELAHHCAHYHVSVCIACSANLSQEGDLAWLRKIQCRECKGADDLRALQMGMGTTQRWCFNVLPDKLPNEVLWYWEGRPVLHVHDTWCVDVRSSFQKFSSIRYGIVSVENGPEFFMFLNSSRLSLHPERSSASIIGEFAEHTTFRTVCELSLLQVIGATINIYSENGFVNSTQVYLSMSPPQEFQRVLGKACATLNQPPQLVAALMNFPNTTLTTITIPE